LAYHALVQEMAAPVTYPSSKETAAPALGRVLVTGATGFIGRALCGRLRQEGFRVRALVRREAEGPWDEVVRADLATEEVPGDCMAGVETVFHLAARVHALAERWQEEESYRRINVEGTRLLLEKARDAGVRRFIFFSSVQAMGEETPACLDENTEPRPVTPYGRSKLEAERLVLAGNTPLHVVCLRFPLVYGPGHKGNLSRMMAGIDRGLFPPLPPVPNRRSMIHVRDVVAAALLAARRPEANGRCYIVTDGLTYSSREMEDAVRRALGRRVPRWHVPLVALRLLARGGDALERLHGHRVLFDSRTLQKFIGSAWYSSERIQRELGYRPSVTLLEALPEIVSDLHGMAAPPATNPA
jgi:UDP-glucose 4-epimerase